MEVEAERMMDEILEIVDEHNTVIGTAVRTEIHRRHLMHRSVHVFLFNSKGELFLQKRSARKDEFPGCYDSSAAGHVSPGESYIEAAARELKEELGIESPLKKIADLPASQGTGWEFVLFYAAASDSAVTPCAEEIEAGDFYPLSEIAQWMSREAAAFTPSFRKLFALYHDMQGEDAGA